MADEFESIGVKSKRQEAVGTEGLPATVFADCQRCGAAAVVKNEGLVVIFEVLFDGG